MWSENSVPDAGSWRSERENNLKSCLQRQQLDDTVSFKTMNLENRKKFVAQLWFNDEYYNLIKNNSAYIAIRYQYSTPSQPQSESTRNKVPTGKITKNTSWIQIYS
jgi:hypothetical protein